MQLRIVLLLSLLILSGGATPAAAAPADTAGLRGALSRITAGHAGVVGISVRNLATGEHLSMRGDEPFPSASLIKVSLLVGLLAEVEAGRVSLDGRLRLLAADRVGGSGVLKHLEPGLEPTVRDAAWLMTVLSDNTATNLLADRVGLEASWRRMDALGLSRTRMHRKVFHPDSTSLLPDSAARYGLGVTTPDETTRLFELLHRGEAVNPSLDSLALQILRGTQDASKLVRWLPSGVAVAHKSGDISQARSDCGIIYSPAAPVAVCVMTRENRDTRFAPDNDAHLLIGRVGRVVFAHYNPAVELPPLPAGR
jgi:beta-lactamase class A